MTLSSGFPEAAVERRHAGVLIIPCENRVPAGNLSLAMRIARRYHFLCPADLSTLLVLRIEPKGAPLRERRIHFGLCPRCGHKWWGPRLGALSEDARPRRPAPFGNRDRAADIADERARQEEADALQPADPAVHDHAGLCVLPHPEHDCLSREHDPDEWCPDCFTPKRATP